MKVTTESGFECEIRERAFDDYRVVKLLARLEAGDDGEKVFAMTELFTRLLGAEQEEALIRHLEETSPDGIATTERMNAEIASVMKAVTESKKK